jgi:hypothetical protein
MVKVKKGDIIVLRESDVVEVKSVGTDGRVNVYFPDFDEVISIHPSQIRRVISRKRNPLQNNPLSSIWGKR